MGMEAPHSWCPTVAMEDDGEGFLTGVLGGEASALAKERTIHIEPQSERAEPARSDDNNQIFIVPYDDMFDVRLMLPYIKRDARKLRFSKS